MGFGLNLHELYRLIRLIGETQHARTRKEYVDSKKTFVYGSEDDLWTATQYCRATSRWAKRSGMTRQQLKDAFQAIPRQVVDHETECVGPTFVDEINPFVSFSFHDWSDTDVQGVLQIVVDQKLYAPKSGYPSQLKFIFFGDPSISDINVPIGPCSILNLSPAIVPPPQPAAQQAVVMKPLVGPISPAELMPLNLGAPVMVGTNYGQGWGTSVYPVRGTTYAMRGGSSEEPDRMGGFGTGQSQADKERHRHFHGTRHSTRYDSSISASSKSTKPSKSSKSSTRKKRSNKHPSHRSSSRR